MLIQVAGIAERPSAVRTLERLEAGVRSNVDLQAVFA